MKKFNTKNKPTINTPNPQKSPPQIPATIKNSQKKNNRYISINLFSTRSSNQNPHLNSPSLFVNKANLMQTPNNSKIFFLKNKFSNSNNHINNSTINMTNMTDSSFKENINPNIPDLDKFVIEPNLITRNVTPKVTLPATTFTPREGFITSFNYAQNIHVAPPKNLFNGGGSSLSNEIKARISSEEARPEQLIAQRALVRTNSLLKLDINSPKIGSYHLGKALSIGSMENLTRYTHSQTKLNNTCSIIEHNLNAMNESNDQMSCRKSNGSSERATVGTQERCMNHPHKKVINMMRFYID